MNNLFAYLRRSYDFGSLQVLEKGIPSFQVYKKATIAEVNAGVTLVAAPGVGYALRFIDSYAISVGGAVGATTTVDILGTIATVSSKLVAMAIAALTQSTLLRAGAANAVILADGGSFVQLDDNTAITAGKTGATATTATHVVFNIRYAVVKTT